MTFFFFRLGHIDQLGDARLAEFFEFQLITRCKRERREIYVPRFVRRDASRDLGSQVHRAITQYFQLRVCRRNASARTLGSARTSIVTSSYLIRGYRSGPNFENYVARVAAS